MQSLVMLATAVVAELVAGQSTDPTQTTPSESVSVTSTAAEATWTNPLIASLWSDAASLISTYYPSATITNVASLSWPSEVVIGSSTHTLATEATTLSTSASPTLDSASVQTPAVTDTTSASTKSDHSQTDHTDKRLGIGLGVGIGCVALGVLVFLIWLLHRRRKQTGSFKAHRPNSPSDAEIQAWRGPSSNSLVQFPEKYATRTAPPPPMPHSASAYTWPRNGEMVAANYNSSSSNSSNTNPFYSPYESYAELSAESSRQVPLHELHGESSMQMMNDRRPPPLMTNAVPGARRSSQHPGTPVHEMMSPMSPISPISPVDDDQHHGFWAEPRNSANPYQQAPSDPDRYTSGHRSLHEQSSSSNPFLSEEDNDDVPNIPSRSPMRRSSPVVHYPSGPEISTFNFGLPDARKEWAEEDYADGGDGWQAQRQQQRRDSSVRRHEMP